MKAKKRSPKRDEAITFLIDFLAGKSKPALDVFEQAECQGIKRRTLEDAAKILRINRSQPKRHNAHFWTLPAVDTRSNPTEAVSAKERFIAACEAAKLTGCFQDRLVFQFAQAAYAAIEEAESMSEERIQTAVRSSSDFSYKALSAAIDTQIKKLSKREGAKVDPFIRLQIQLDVLQRAGIRQTEDGVLYLPQLRRLKSEFLAEFETARKQAEIDADS